MSWAHSSANIIVGAFVFPDSKSGITDASATRRPEIPLTLKSESQTEKSSGPIRAVHVGW